MDIRILEFDEAKDLAVRGWIPYDYVDELENMYVFGGFDEDVIICAAVFEDSLIKRFAVEMKHIYMHRDYRGRGLAKELYTFCENSFLNIGIKEIDYNCIVDKDLAEFMVSLLNAFGFAPMYIDRRVMRYARGHFRGDKSNLLFDNIKKLGMTIESISDYSDRRLLAFMERKDETGIYIARDEYDPNMCAFVTVNDRIEAALCMKVMDSKSIIVEGYYTSDKIKQQDQLLPFLMSYLVKKNEDIMPGRKDYERIYVVCKKDYRADAIVKTFGEAIEEYYKQQYIKRFGW